MKPGAAETAPLLQRDETLISKPKPGAIAAAVRQAKRGVGVFGVALALSGVLVAIMAGAPDSTKRTFDLQMAATMEIKFKPGITRMQQNLAYWQTYWQSMGWLFLVICCLTLINCFVITTTRLDKKV